MKKTAEERFWNKVDVRGPDECWKWTAYANRQGYGRIRVDGKSVRTHRFSWVLAYPEGAIEKLCVLHKCDTPSCVNPSYLFLGTQLDNVKDRDQKERQAVGERVGTAKLTRDQVLDIYNDPRSLKEIAQDYPVSQMSIGDIKRGKRWGHITKHNGLM